LSIWGMCLQRSLNPPIAPSVGNQLYCEAVTIPKIDWHPVEDVQIVGLYFLVYGEMEKELLRYFQA